MSVSLELQVPFVDLRAEYATIQDEVVRGQWVEHFEEEFAAYVGARYAIGVGSGTPALELALKSTGIGPMDEVIVPSNTLFAPAEAVSNVGAKPVFAEADPETLHLNAKRPLISVLLAVRDESRYVEASLTSLLRQFTSEFDLEILVLDGQSSDGTAEIVGRIARTDHRIRLFVNEQQKTPCAFNLGLRESRGEFVCILGAHAIYEENYVSVCLDELKRHGAIACGGLVITRPSDDNLQAKLVAWALSHPFGSSTRSFRTRGEGFVESVNYPVIVKRALVEAGGYDEQLHRNQDNDMNQRLRARGHKLFLTGKTRCLYFAKSTLASYLEHAFRTGSWNWYSLRRNKWAMGLRHFVPFLFVLALLLSVGLVVSASFSNQTYRLFLRLPVFLILGSHLFCGLLAGIHVSIRERSFGALLLPFVFLGFHVSYGLGTLWAFLRGARS